MPVLRFPLDSPYRDQGSSHGPPRREVHCRHAERSQGLAGPALYRVRRGVRSRSRPGAWRQHCRRWFNAPEPLPAVRALQPFHSAPPSNASVIWERHITERVSGHCLNRRSATNHQLVIPFPRKPRVQPSPMGSINRTLQVPNTI